MEWYIGEPQNNYFEYFYTLESDPNKIFLLNNNHTISTLSLDDINDQPAVMRDANSASATQSEELLASNPTVEQIIVIIVNFSSANNDLLSSDDIHLILDVVERLYKIILTDPNYAQSVEPPFNNEEGILIQDSWQIASYFQYYNNIEMYLNDSEENPLSKKISIIEKTREIEEYLDTNFQANRLANVDFYDQELEPDSV